MLPLNMQAHAAMPSVSGDSGASRRSLSGAGTISGSHGRSLPATERRTRAPLLCAVPGVRLFVRQADERQQVGAVTSCW